MSHALIITGMIIVIAAYGYIQPRLFGRHYTAANLVFSLFTVGFAALAGASFKNLGLGIGWTALIITTVIILLISTAGLTAIKRRKLRLSNHELYEYWLRIPIGTALSEELIFRAALLGLVMQYYTHMTALLVSSLVFGFWHILPAQTWAQRAMPNLKLPHGSREHLPSAATITFTTCAGILFGGLRLITGSVWVSWSVHAFTNSAGWLVSKAVLKLEGNHAAD